MLNGERHGYGTQVWPDGATYIGEWSRNMAEGNGKFIHINGDIYEGQWKADKANGHGVCQHVDRAKYEGEWVDDLQKGVLVKKYGKMGPDMKEHISKGSRTWQI